MRRDYGHYRRYYAGGVLHPLVQPDQRRYYHYINMAVENCISTGKIIQVEYTWNHPAKGEVTVRCMTVRAADKEGKICLEAITGSSASWSGPTFCLTA